jgi:thiamine biosynthesis lipoprotein
MGSAFSFTAIHAEKDLAWQAVKKGISEVSRIESVISSWDPNSQTSAINKMAGKEAVSVEPELFDLIERALKISDISNGYFDISFAAAGRLWKFDGSEQRVPAEEAILQSVALVNYKNIELNREMNTVFLKKEGMRIGFGAIGKGYAANRASLLMKEMGIESGVVNAGGDLLAWGYQTDEKPWSIGITNPADKFEILAWVDITNTAVVTSGDYEKYALINGERYGHIIDPKTGWPVKGITSVTIICPDAELADALATTVFVLGLEDGMALVNHLKDVEAIIIEDSQQIHYSKNLEERLIKNEGNAKK